MFLAPPSQVAELARLVKTKANTMIACYGNCGQFVEGAHYCSACVQKAVKNPKLSKEAKALAFLESKGYCVITPSQLEGMRQEYAEERETIFLGDSIQEALGFSDDEEEDDEDYFIPDEDFDTQMLTPDQAQNPWDHWVGAQTPAEFLRISKGEGAKTLKEAVESYVNTFPQIFPDAKHQVSRSWIQSHLISYIEKQLTAEEIAAIFGGQ